MGKSPVEPEEEREGEREGGREVEREEEQEEVGELSSAPASSAPASSEPALPEPPVKDLLRKLGHDMGRQVRREVQLAKIEIRGAMQGLARDGARVLLAFGLLLLAAFSLMLFAILFLGEWLDNYWLSALLIGLLLLLVGGVLARGSVGDAKTGSLKPVEPITPLPSGVGPLDS